jgi:ligand-binding SRPBCC domain-containing protein
MSSGRLRRRHVGPGPSEVGTGADTDRIRHVLTRRQIVPGTLEEVFRFFESPWNLEEITPPWLRFEVLSATDRTIRRGTRIVYRLRWQGVPMLWHTRIAECEPGVMFADEMTRGPYRAWYHRHSFAEVPGGVEVSDMVEYELPLGWVGRIVDATVVRAQLERIFEYRRRAVSARFGAFPARTEAGPSRGKGAPA